MTTTAWDYIIVGAGSAGCVLANRLSADPACRVLLMEAGGPANLPEVRVPARYSALQNTHLDWAYRTTPQAELYGRCLNWPRGRALGGSSAINYMAYVRGIPLDFDRWAAAGTAGWGYEDVLPYFIRSEHNHNLADEYHGQDGPHHVTTVAEPNPLAARFLHAASEIGLPVSPDVNGRQFTGVGRYQANVMGGERCSGADAFLLPILDRPNLAVLTRALALQIHFTGTRASAISYLHEGMVKRADVAGELLLTAGAINSPHLLMLSGIGPAAHLRSHGLTVVQDLPGVGENLQDHLRLTVGCEINQPWSLSGLDEAAAEEVARQYAADRSGPLASNILEVGGFVQLLPDEPAPDTQLFFYADLPSAARASRAPRHGFGMSCYTGRPYSRGTIRLASADPLDQPLLDPNYLAEPGDWAAALAGLRCLMALMEADAFADVRAGGLMPDPARRREAELIDYIRTTAETGYHPVGSCKMGQDALAVVDGELRVYGVTGLRVIDASIMPNIVSGNTNAPTVMIAEKGADLVQGRG
ncbi:MAG: GMC family oxidoreductase N-terminal domain-containing protein [Ardenticatenales bacterium]|nr:GMC family oxidoreductase N-terminal domain-containing protein [Ardenticatenales bacterium]